LRYGGRWTEVCAGISGYGMVRKGLRNRDGEHVGGSAQSAGRIDAFYDIGIGGTGRDGGVYIGCLGIYDGIEDRVCGASFEGTENLIANDRNSGTGWCGPTEAH